MRNLVERPRTGDWSIYDDPETGEVWAVGHDGILRQVVRRVAPAPAALDLRMNAANG